MTKKLKNFLAVILLIVCVITFPLGAAMSLGNGFKVEAKSGKFIKNTFTVGGWYQYTNHGGYGASADSYFKNGNIESATFYSPRAITEQDQQEQTAQLARDGMNLIDLPISFGGAGAGYGSIDTNATNFVNVTSGNYARHYDVLDEVCEENNMYYFLQIPNISNFANAYSIANGRKNCIGYHLKDEPGDDSLDAYGEMYQEFFKGDPLRTPYINMLPSYAGSAALGGSFEHYLEHWVTAAGGEDLDILYFDYYPFAAGASGSGAYDGNYYSALETMRKVAYNNGKLPTGAFTQAGCWNGRRFPVESEFRWNFNSYIAYGFKSISHFCWVAPGYVSVANGGEAMTKHIKWANGEPSELYEPAVIMNWQARQLGKILIDIDVQHAYHGGSAPSGAEALPASFFIQPQTSSNFVFSIAYHKETNEPYLMIFDKRLTGSTSNYTFSINGSASGVDTLKYYKPTDFTMSTLPDPTDLSTLADPEEINYNVSSGSVTLSFKPGEVKLFKLEGKNGVSLLDPLGKPKSTHNSGIYSGSQQVRLYTEDPGASIYYTLDGSFPVVGSATTYKYSTPITVGDGENVCVSSIRAVEVRGAEISDVADFDITTTVASAINLAYQKPIKIKSRDLTRDITSSFISLESSPHDINVANDNSFSPTQSCWRTSEPAWVCVDLGAEYTVNKIVTSFWHDFTYNDCWVQLSKDESFSGGTSVYAQYSMNHTDAGITISFTPYTARYVRITNQANNEYTHGETWTMMTEIQVFGCEGADIAPNLAQGKTPYFMDLGMTQNVTSSIVGFNGSANNLTLMTDNNYSPTESVIYYPSGFCWAIIDLGALYTIDTIKFAMWHNWTFSNVIIDVATDANFTTNLGRVFDSGAGNVKNLAYEDRKPITVNFAARSARYVRFTNRTVSDSGSRSIFTELQVFKALDKSVSKDIIADASIKGGTYWSPIHGGSYTNNGASITTTGTGGGWEQGYNYNAKTLKNFIIEGTATINSSFGGFFGLIFLKNSTTTHWNSGAGTNYSILVNSAGRAYMYNGDGNQYLTMASSDASGWSIGSAFTFKLAVNNGTVSFSINGVPKIFYQNSSDIGRSGYFSLQTGTCSMTISSLRLTELSDDLTFVDKQGAIKSYTAERFAVELGTTESQAIALLGSTVTVKDNYGKSYTVSVDNWITDDEYDGNQDTSWYTYVAVLNKSSLAAKNIVNPYDIAPVAQIFIKPVLDKTVINRYINIANTLVQANYKSGSSSDMTTWQYFMTKYSQALDLVSDEFQSQSGLNVGTFQLKDALNTIEYVGSVSGTAQYTTDFSGAVWHAPVSGVFNSSYVTSNFNSSTKVTYDDDMGYSLLIPAAANDNGSLLIKGLSTGTVYKVSMTFKVCESGKNSATNINGYLIKWDVADKNLVWYMDEDGDGFGNYWGERPDRDNVFIKDPDTGVYTLEAYLPAKSDSSNLSLWLSPLSAIYGFANQDYYIGSISVVATSHTYNASPRSDNANLSDIKVKGSTIDGFSSSVTNYTIYYTTADEVPAKSDVTYTLSDVVARAEVTKSGNKVTLTVTAEDGETNKSYVIEYLQGDIITEATLSIGKSLTLNYYVILTKENEDAFMKFTYKGRIYNVEHEAEKVNGKYVYKFTDISPQSMGANVKAELMKGTAKLDTKAEYSVAIYCANMLAKTREELGFTEEKFAAFRTLISDLIVYGGAAQRYMYTDLDNLVNADASLIAYASEFDPSEVVSAKNGIASSDANTYIASAGVILDNENAIVFNVYAKSATSKTVKLYRSVDGKAYELYGEYDLTEVSKDGDYYRIVTDGISATENGTVFKAKLCDGETELQWVTYSIDSYVKGNYGNKRTGDLLKSLYNYGKSSENYENA